ncbi:MAG: Gfo/Idh/MocA family oxidoreductase [Oscillospiraceae bacterium]|nr:Gfo/Idh/MocA family oxidoreductase [Oscillospiraceae bacterium]
MIRIGIICPSEIALRRFMPALVKNEEFVFAGVAVPGADEYFVDEDDGMDLQTKKSILDNEREKAKIFTDNYGGDIYDSYEAIVTSENIDAIYIPLPPALHYKWCRRALENGKHVLLEKPATLEAAQTKELVSMASERSLALHENYMFAFHNQLEKISSLVKEGMLGDIRLYRITFGFPRREANDFRYNKSLGGGALYDAGGYTIKYASMLLGSGAKIVYANMSYIDGFDVDIYGSAALIDDSGTTVQVAFGMDNSYRCDLEIWGSTGLLTTGRILTAPDGFVPEAKIKSGNKEEILYLPVDDSFGKSIAWFRQCIDSDRTREKSYANIIRQALLVNEFKEKSV